ncbi:TrmH family RNA methyltransferase [Ferviditalea candida]|uniref:RNA methyltransferase n=1 Tax=Ferviditalea candida TaxID=3108399 RepID=A0ABU5ZKS6_9BACL|nr:RNA methyltransferase [Paenibacillaceae bacterium T2]
MEIRSVNNPKVKQWAELMTKKGRDKQEKFLTEGIHLVQEALASGARIEALIYSLERGFPDEVDRGMIESGRPLEIFGVAEAVLSKITDARSPQGVCAVIEKPGIPLETLLKSEPSLAVLVDGVQDPGNLGTIIRSADAVGADAVIVGQGTVDVYNPKTVRSTMGSLFHIPVVEADLPQLLHSMQSEPIQIVNTSLQAQMSCYEADFTRRTWFLVGNEAGGVSAEAAQYADTHIKIPMHGQAESLNVAMATTVLLYEALRQRHYPTQINSYQSK